MTDKEKTLFNLKRVYNELPVLAEKIPAIKNDFHMGRFGVYDNLMINHCNEHDCKTVGCGLGHIARLFKPIPEYFNVLGLFDYVIFCRIEFPYVNYTHLWHFLFDSLWFGYQPKFEQFIERVKYVIDYELEIPEWNYQEESFIKQPNA